MAAAPSTCGAAAPPTVSIMNVRNGASTLAVALQSVLAQTFADWELVVWDGGSTDGSQQVVAAFAEPRIRSHASPSPTHLAAARVQAMAQARGSWLAFLDQDDVWLPHKLQHQMALAQDGVDLVYGRTVKYFEHGGRRDFDHRHEHRSLPEGDIFQALVAQSCFICMSSAMLRRVAVQRAGAMPSGLQVAPDYWLFLALSRAGAARAVQEPVCLYRVHDGGMTAASLGPIQDEALALLLHFEPHIPSVLLRKRRAVHHSVGAYVQMCTAGQRGAGLQRLLKRGAVGYLLSRPLARAWRAGHRRLHLAQWQVTAQQAGLVLPMTLPMSLPASLPSTLPMTQDQGRL